MKRALIVGIDDYPISPLHGCVNDANSIGTILESNGDGSPNFSIKLLTSLTTNITRPSLREAIDQLFSGDPNMALLYFSGHGLLTASGGFLVTQDATKYDEGVSMDEVLNWANNSKATNKVIILDCCHSGAFGTPNIPANILAQLSQGLSILTASQTHEPALEFRGSGVFTSLVVDALKGGAADLRGNITPGSLYAYVDEALGAWEQRPIFKTNVASFTPIRKIPPRVPLDKIRKLTEYFSSPEIEFALDPTFEETDPRAKPENVKIFKDLQKFFSIGLLVPVDEDYMYYAAVNSKGCRLTAMGFQYWRLVHEKKL